MSRIVVIGEAMIEETFGEAGVRSRYGGDTLNTAVHLARLGHDVAYVTAIGSDPESRALKETWSAEGIDTAFVLEHPVRTIGRYSIALDPHGERTFTYQRDRSAAREMFALRGMSAALLAAESADLVIYSLITLAILPPAARARLLKLNIRLAFDGNYRPRLWPDPSIAAKARDTAIARAIIGLPTLEDEALMAGPATTAHSVAQYWQALGCDETVVKLGPGGCRLPDGQIIAPPAVLQPIDTSGAGDAFNAGYLAARLAGSTPGEAAFEGHRLAGWTIMRLGAIPPASR